MIIKGLGNDIVSSFIMSQGPIATLYRFCAFVSNMPLYLYSMAQLTDTTHQQFLETSPVMKRYDTVWTPCGTIRKVKLHVHQYIDSMSLFLFNLIFAVRIQQWQRRTRWLSRANLRCFSQLDLNFYDELVNTVGSFRARLVSNKEEKKYRCFKSCSD